MGEARGTAGGVKVGVDKEGRWVFVKGKLAGQEITLGCIYAPNQGQLELLGSGYPIMRDYISDQMVTSGDFNGVAKVKLDRYLAPLIEALH